MQHSVSLTDGPITRGLFQFAVPILCANVLQSLSGSLSAFWVGRYLGEAALTAITNSQSLILLLTGAAMGITMAATILVGQCIGEKDLAAAKRVVSTGLAFFVVIAIVLALVGGVFAELVLRSMQTSAASLPMAVAYVRMMFLALPVTYSYAFVMSLLRGTGDSRTPLKFMLLSVAIEAVCSPILIFGVGPLAGVGIVGAGLATLLAQAVSLTTLVLFLYARRHPLCLHRGELTKLHWSIVSTLLRKGVPMGGQVLVISLGSVLMIALVNRFGIETTAAYGASLLLWNYIVMPALAITMAASAMTALNLGARRWDRVRKIAIVGVVYCAAVTGLIVLCVSAADSYVYRWFLPADSPALQIASHINRIATWSLILTGMSMVMFGVVRGAGAVMAPLLIYAASLLAVRFPVAALLEERWQEDAIWWSFPISSAVALALATVYFRYGRWRPACSELPAREDRSVRAETRELRLRQPSSYRE